MLNVENMETSKNQFQIEFFSPAESINRFIEKSIFSQPYCTVHDTQNKFNKVYSSLNNASFGTFVC